MRMKKLISGALAAAMVGTLPIPAAAKDFPDAAGHWAQNAISVWSDRGVVNGDDQGNFRPGDSITRAETATILDNLIGYEKQSVKVFSDVNRSDWFALAISRLYEAGVITGYEDGSIRPSASISRQEAAVMIGRALGLETDAADTSALNQFNDLDQIQSWAKPTVALMAKNGFIQGSDGVFRPGDPITRAEIVTILNNMIAIYATTDGGTYSGDYSNKIAVVKESTTFNGVVLGGVVVSPKLSGKVNFNSGTRISGRLYNLSPNATLNTAGATIGSTSSPNGSASGNSYNSGSGSTSSGGSGFGGGSSSGSNNKTTYRITFNANGGSFDSLDSSYSASYSRGTVYRVNAPNNPTRTGYTFVGWYFTQTGANELDSEQAVNMSSLVTGTTILYAGWEKISGKYGDVLPATGMIDETEELSASDLMTNVKLDSTGTADSYRANGNLKYVSSYQNAPGLEREGHFLALTYTLPSSLDAPKDAVVTSSFDSTSESSEVYHRFTDETRSFTRIFYVTKCSKQYKIIFKVDLDGDGTAQKEHEIVIDISGLDLDPNPVVSETVTTEEELTAALAKSDVNQIVVDSSITLADNGIYASENGRKTLVLAQPLMIPENASVTLKDLDIKPNSDQTVKTIIENAAKEVTVPPAEEGGEATTETIITKAASLTFAGNQVTGSFASGAIAALQTATLTVTDNTFTGTGADSCAIVLPDSETADTVTITGNTFDQYGTALTYSNLTVTLTKNKFLDNTTDISVPAATAPAALPNLAYNYFKDGSVISGGSAICLPEYTDAECTKLSENTHDAYLFIGDDTEPVLLSETTMLTLAEGGLTITVVPTDTRDEKVTINEAETNTAAVTEVGTLTITIGETSHTVTVEAASETPAV